MTMETFLLWIAVGARRVLRLAGGGGGVRA